MKPVILIDPPGLTKGYNTGLAHISAVLTKEKITHKIIDLNTNPKGVLERLKDIKKADWAGISIKTATLANSIKLAKIIKELNPNIKLIAGGAHISIDGLNLMKENPLFDYAFCREAEKELVKLIKGKELIFIGNLYYQKNKNICFTKKAELITKLDELPFPNFERFDSIKKNIQFYPLTTSRGCPFQCIYCSVPNVIGRKWRARKPAQLIKELKLAKIKYGIKGFEILDDNFTLNKERAKRFCGLLLKEKLNLKWCCSNGLRADSLDEELIALMKKAGCFSVSLGIESGHPEVFKNVNKSETLEGIGNTIKLLKKYDIELFGYFIIGLPGSTYKKDMESVRYCRKLNIRGAFNVLAPYPSTPLWQIINANPKYRKLMDWKKGLHFSNKINVVFDTKKYPMKLRIKTYHRANFRSGSYGTFFDKNKSLAVNFLILMKKILIYDPLFLPYHLISLMKVYQNYLKKFNRIS